MKLSKKHLSSFLICGLLACSFIGCDADKLNKTASNINKAAYDVAPESAKGLFKDDFGKIKSKKSRSGGISNSIQTFYKDAEKTV